MTWRYDPVPVETLTKDCAAGCGAKVSREVPDPSDRFGMLARQMPWVCDPCTARSNREESERAAAEETAATEARSKLRREKSGIPEHLWSFRFASIDRPAGLERAIDAAMRWAAGDLNGLILSGPNGVGKTRVAVAAANAMVDLRKVRYFSAPLLLARLGTGDFANPMRRDALDALTGNAALVLDDLDKTRPSAYAAEALFVAIDQRADGAAPLLVTTNLKVRELADMIPAPFGEAIASRLRLLEGVRVDGADRRAGR
jgi:DNA replication protein DnaC